MKRICDYRSIWYKRITLIFSYYTKKTTKNLICQVIKYGRSFYNKISDMQSYKRLTITKNWKHQNRIFSWVYQICSVEIVIDCLKINELTSRMFRMLDLALSVSASWSNFFFHSKTCPLSWKFLHMINFDLSTKRKEKKGMNLSKNNIPEVAEW